ncbi:MAG: hypothetical protein N2112_08820 [Gemmataceae bacterium]|jgi:predicted phage terminase large subunit-like protein|nr:hypothetical protein [Gemmataceae bacterium]
MLQLEWTIRQARRDPNRFLEWCFTTSTGQPIQQGKLHRELQAFWTQNRKGLVELPRDHGKTFQICGRILWELGHAPNLRIRIVCATEALALERGRFLRDSISHNRRLGWVFPHLTPSSPWNETRFTVNRTGGVIGPSVTSCGIDSGSTGARCDLLICDDVVDVQAMFSSKIREHAKKMFRDNLMNLLEPDGRVWCLFTPWHRDDLNQELKQSKAFALFRRAIGPNLEPIWPERWPRDALAQRRAEIGTASFARGYHLQPISEEDCVIPRQWVRFWEQLPESFDRVILAVDPAVSHHEHADFSALVTVGQKGGRFFCLDALQTRIPAPDLVRLLGTLNNRFQPDVILFEANAAFRAVVDLLIQQNPFGYKIKPIVHNHSKASRIDALGLAVENGSFLLRGVQGQPHPEQQPLYEQLTQYPLCEHDDLIDAAATVIVESHRVPMPTIRLL